MAATKSGIYLNFYPFGTLTAAVFEIFEVRVFDVRAFEN